MKTVTDKDMHKQSLLKQFTWYYIYMLYCIIMYSEGVM